MHLYPRICAYSIDIFLILLTNELLEDWDLIKQAESGEILLDWNENHQPDWPTVYWWPPTSASSKSLGLLISNYMENNEILN